ncbi:AraC-type DNA-binding protein [Alkalispirochaeta americana]|uniref:AraC-type DNA-binding protein n=1 Tax=Alkalispirochaeta americana TaxID=159291 RepID=A0A1N6TVJ7_9SPIO|nr:AraC family transcriptional regulator [Alkalispirochaeta americana]SIQ57271.1 AraC-type DNA-binding protein [Alkalispirochaeta americana]
MENQHDRGRRDGDFVLGQPSEIENELPYQLVGAGCDFFQYPVKRPFGFPAFQWIQTISGTGSLSQGDDTHTARPGEGLLLHPNEPHRYQALEDPWYVHWITFSGYHVRDMLSYLGMSTTGVYGVAEPMALASHIRKALGILKSDYPLRGIDGSVVVYQLMMDFFKFVHSAGGTSHDAHVRRLKPALDRIEREIHRSLTLEDLAQEVGVTPQYFCELFKSITRYRPTEYINQRRVERAKNLLLRNPRDKVHDIARQVGFESDSYFSTVFRKYEGVSPRTYRETNGPLGGG